jgi:hypothetical protein
MGAFHSFDGPVAFGCCNLLKERLLFKSYEPSLYDYSIICLHHEKEWDKQVVVVAHVETA